LVASLNFIEMVLGCQMACIYPVRPRELRLKTGFLLPLTALFHIASTATVYRNAFSLNNRVGYSI
jgi:hypothetical protein